MCEIGTKTIHFNFKKITKISSKLLKNFKQDHLNTLTKSLGKMEMHSVGHKSNQGLTGIANSGIGYLQAELTSFGQTLKAVLRLKF